MKKKLVVAMLSLTMAMSFTACGGTSAPTKTETKTEASAVDQTNTDDSTEEGQTTEQAAENKEEAPSVPAEFKSALKKAQIYSDTMHMSKQGIYDQLSSEYGEKFSAEAAQYAIDNVKADWNVNALEKAKIYQDQMAMSPEAIRDQLASEYGEKFTPEEADYAVANLPQ